MRAWSAHRNCDMQCRKKQIPALLDANANVPDACRNTHQQCDACLLKRGGFLKIDISGASGGGAAVAAALLELFTCPGHQAGNIDFNAVVGALEKDPGVTGATADVNRILKRTSAGKHLDSAFLTTTRLAEQLVGKGVLTAHATKSAYTSGARSSSGPVRVAKRKVYYRCAMKQVLHRRCGLRGGEYVPGTMPDLGCMPHIGHKKMIKVLERVLATEGSGVPNGLANSTKRALTSEPPSSAPKKPRTSQQKTGKGRTTAASTQKRSKATKAAASTHNDRPGVDKRTASQMAAATTKNNKKPKRASTRNRKN